MVALGSRESGRGGDGDEAGERGESGARAPGASVEPCVEPWIEAKGWRGWSRARGRGAAMRGASTGTWGGCVQR